MSDEWLDEILEDAKWGDDGYESIENRAKAKAAILAKFDEVLERLKKDVHQHDGNGEVSDLIDRLITQPKTSEGEDG